VNNIAAALLLLQLALSGCAHTAGQSPGASCPAASTPTSVTSSTTPPITYLVCGDGTLVDTSTGLMWEMKDTACASGDVHCVGNKYNWSGASYTSCPPCGPGTNIKDGTMFTVFLATLNDDIDTGSPNWANACFANHCDWRIPKEAELQTIYDANPTDAPGCVSGAPCIDQAAFDPPGYSTEPNLYWSSTTDSACTCDAWIFLFQYPQTGGNASTVAKGPAVPGGGAWVRAVRGGR
jgi:hypothetical protein